MLTRAEVDALREEVVRAYMKADDAAYCAAMRQLTIFVEETKRARGLVKMGVGTWTRDPKLFTFEHRGRFRKKGERHEEASSGFSPGSGSVAA